MHSLNDRIAACQRDIADCRVLRGAAYLRQQNGDADATVELESLEAEIDTHQKTIARLEDAQKAQAAQHTEEALSVRRKAVKSAGKEIAKLDKELDAVVTALLTQIDGAAPLVAQLTAALIDRDRAMSAAIRARGQSVRLDSAALTRLDSAISEALKASLSAAGLARARLIDASEDSKPVSTDELLEQLARPRERTGQFLEAIMASIDGEA